MKAEVTKLLLDGRQVQGLWIGASFPLGLK